MATNKIELRSMTEVMNDYRPTYKPLYALFLGSSEAYSEEVGEVAYKEITTVGDIRAKHITPKDTEMHQIAVGASSKIFKKYFLGTQYIVSDIQNQEGSETVVAQVLDEHQVQMDEMFLFGESTDSGTTVVNNGLFYSKDPNYNLRSSVNVPAGDQSALHTAMVTAYNDIKDQDGRKVLILYGAGIMSIYDSIYASTTMAFKKVIQDVLEGVSITEIPNKVTPSGLNGFIFVNLDRIKLNYVKLPELDDQDYNREKKYYWHNFVMGSCMVDVREPNAVTRQPVAITG